MQSTWNPKLQKLEGHTDWVNSVAFSPDGQLLASVSDDQTVRLWNPATGEQLQKLEGHTDWVSSVTFSPDGPFLETNRGLLKVECYTPPVSLIQSDSIAKIFVKEHWIAQDLQQLLWLPSEYRPTCSAFRNNVLALGCSSGQLIFLEFS